MISAVTRPDPFSLLPCMLLDAGVVRDLADALDGRWRPEGESDVVRRERLLSAARVRLYGERDRSGWYVITYREARASALKRGDTDWSVGFLPDVTRFDDAPSETDLQALARMHLESGMEAEAGLALAYAVLYEPVRALVTTTPKRFRHGREFDLPERLDILSPAEAFDDMSIDPGEEAPLAPPPGSTLAEGPHWWIP
jgi:hypothetical protein